MYMRCFNENAKYSFPCSNICRFSMVLFAFSYSTDSSKLVTRPLVFGLTSISSPFRLIVQEATAVEGQKPPNLSHSRHEAVVVQVFY